MDYILIVVKTSGQTNQRYNLRIHLTTKSQRQGKLHWVGNLFKIYQGCVGLPETRQDFFRQEARS